MASFDGASTSPALLRKLWNPDNDEEAWRIFLARYRPLIQGWCRVGAIRPLHPQPLSF
jgi:hypothetical protein